MALLRINWTEENVQTLVKLWNSRHSASEIARALGYPNGRNAIIGKAHRTPECKSRDGIPPICRKKMERRSARRLISARKASSLADAAAFRATLARRAAENFSASERASQEGPEPLRASLSDLKVSMCRWPIGDPQDAGFAFCGHQRIDDAPYCEHHARIAYPAYAERKRREIANA